MVARSQHHDRVHLAALDEILRAGERALGPVTLRALLGQRRGQIADRRELKLLGQLSQIWEMHDLGDQPAPHDSDPDRLVQTISSLERSTHYSEAEKSVKPYDRSSCPTTGQGAT